VFDSNWMKVAYPSERTMEPLLVNPCELRHIEQLDRRYGDVPNRIVLLMLNHLKKPASELKTPIEDWAYVFNDQALRSDVEKIIPETKELVNIESIANRNPGIREFIDRIDVNNLPREVWDRYMRAIHYYNTTIMDIEEKAVEKGKKEGKKEGIKEGMKEGKKQSIKKGIKQSIKEGIKEGKKEGLLVAALVMKKLQISTDQIVQATGLSAAEIDGIKAEDID